MIQRPHAKARTQGFLETPPAPPLLSLVARGGDPARCVQTNRRRLTTERLAAAAVRRVGA